MPGNQDDATRDQAVLLAALSTHFSLLVAARITRITRTAHAIQTSLEAGGATRRDREPEQSRYTPFVLPSKERAAMRTGMLPLAG